MTEASRPKLQININSVSLIEPQTPHGRSRESPGKSWLVKVTGLIVGPGVGPTLLLNMTQ